MIVKTNVKLNLGLSVLRKRADGFHDIETLFVPCFDFGDTLEIIAGDDYSRTSAALFAEYGGQDGCVGKFCDQKENEVDLAQGISEDGKLMITIARKEGVDWNPMKDLCAKAYNVLAQDFDLPPVKIFLEKNAPVGAGLGGGSADAAFTLKALNELCGLGLSGQRLSEYASRLGSDCAFFIFNRPMIGSGRGEVLEPYDIDLSEYEIKVLIPEGVSVSTAEAYKGIVPRETRRDGSGEQDSTEPQERCDGSGEQNSTGSPERCDRFSEQPGNPVVSHRSPTGLGKPAETTGLKSVLAEPVSEWKDLLVNDFEATVFKAHPELAAIKQSLYDSGATYASMSGSGSALFALYKK